MSYKNQALRALVVERLAVAADEIFALFERTFAEYEEEVLRSKLLQETRVELLPVLLPAAPPDVHQSPEQTEEDQPLRVKKEEEPPVELPFAPLPLKHEENADKEEPADESKQETIEKPYAAEEPGCSLHLRPDDDERHHSGSDTDDSEDWEPCTKRSTKSDGQDSDLVLIEDSNTGRDDENELLSFSSFSDDANAMIHLQNQGYFNLPASHVSPDEEPCRCSVCGKYFNQKSHLRRHMRSHSAEPITCSVCSKEFTQKAHLKRHMHSHSEEKSFSCPECGLRLKQQHNMHRHISAVHRREKPFSCLFCQKAFAQKSDFIIHMRTHTGEKPFVCTFCRKGFRVRASLNKHIQKSHAGVQSR